MPTIGEVRIQSGTGTIYFSLPPVSVSASSTTGSDTTSVAATTSTSVSDVLSVSSSGTGLPVLADFLPAVPTMQLVLRTLTGGTGITLALVNDSIVINATNHGAVTAVVAGAGLTGGTITTSGTISLPASGVTTGTYTYPTLVVDSYGRITTINSNAATGVAAVIAGAGLAGGTITTSGTISLSASGVTAGTYTYATVAVDTYGRVTSIGNNTVATGVTAVTAGTGLAGGTIRTNGIISLSASGVTVGTYTYPTVVVDTYGRVTSIGNNAAVSAVTAGAGLAGGTISTSGIISLSASGVTAGTYTYPTVAVDTYGRVTSIGNNIITTGVTAITAGAGLAGGAITTVGTISLSASGVTVGTYTYPTLVVDSYGRVTSIANNAVATQTITLSGPQISTTTGSTALSVTFATTGVSTGTYTKLRVDTYGRVLAGLSLAASDISTALGSALSMSSLSAATLAVAASAQVPTVSSTDNSTNVATTAWVIARGYLPLAATSTITSGQLTLATANTATNAGLTVAGPAGTARGLVFASAASTRWAMTTTAEAEAGSNAGSNLSIAAYSDTQTLLGTPLLINRQSQTVQIPSLQVTTVMTAPTAATTDNSNAVATTAFVNQWAAAQARFPRRVLLMGDSLTANNAYYTPPSITITGQGWFGWANRLLGQRIAFNPQLNFGVSDDLTGQMLARYTTDVAANYANFDIMMLLGGTIDLLQSVTPSITFANLTTMATSAAAAGKLVVLMPPPPFVNPSSFGVSNMVANQMWLLTMLREWALTQRNVVYVDYWRSLEDPTSSSGGGLASLYQGDGIHPESGGGYRMAVALAAALRPLVPASSNVAPSAADLYDVNYNPLGSWVTNGFFLTSSGGTLASGSGTVASGWTLQLISGTAPNSAIVASVVPQTGGIDALPGSKQVLTINIPSGNTNNENIELYSVITGITAGQKVVMECEIDVSGIANLWYVAAIIVDHNGSDNLENCSDGLGDNNVSYWDPDGTYTRLVYRTPVYPVEFGTALLPTISICLDASAAAASATIAIGAITLRVVG